jgi:hypothetical protein
MAAKVTGGANSAVAASSHAACTRSRGTDPLITGVTHRKLAAQIGHSKRSQSTIPLLRWTRAMAFERLVRDRRFAAEVVTDIVEQADERAIRAASEDARKGFGSDIANAREGIKKGGQAVDWFYNTNFAVNYYAEATAGH